MRDDAIVALAERHIVAAGMKGRRLARFAAGDRSWHLDLDNDEVRVGGRTFGVDVVGTASYADDAWVWGWASPEFEDRHTASALRLRELGETSGYARLADDRALPLTTMDPELAGIIATGEARAPGCIAGGYDDGGGMIVLLLHGPELAGEPYESTDLAETLTEITDVPVNHRRAVRGFEELPEPGFGVAESRDAEVVFTAPGGTVRVLFDDGGRIADVRAELASGR